MPTEIEELKRLTERLRHETVAFTVELPTVDGVIMTDIDGFIEFANPAAHVTFGYSDSELLGKHVTELMPPAYRDAHNKAFKKYVETRKGRFIDRIIEATGLRRDGTSFPLLISLHIFQNESLHLVAVIRDKSQVEIVKLV